MAAGKSTKAFYEDLLSGVFAAMKKNPGDSTHDDVVDAAVEALADQPLRAIFGAICHVADKPDLVRLLCNTAQTTVEFCSEDLASIASALGYRPIAGLARHA